MVVKKHDQIETNYQYNIKRFLFYSHFFSRQNLYHNSRRYTLIKSDNLLWFMGQIFWHTGANNLDWDRDNRDKKNDIERN